VSATTALPSSFLSRVSCICTFECILLGYINVVSTGLPYGRDESSISPKPTTQLQEAQPACMHANHANHPFGAILSFASPLLHTDRHHNQSAIVNVRNLPSELLRLVGKNPERWGIYGTGSAALPSQISCPLSTVREFVALFSEPILLNLIRHHHVVSRNADILIETRQEMESLSLSNYGM
jgi:hypothetical protein